MLFGSCHLIATQNLWCCCWFWYWCCVAIAWWQMTAKPQLEQFWRLALGWSNFVFAYSISNSISYTPKKSQSSCTCSFLGSCFCKSTQLSRLLCLWQCFSCDFQISAPSLHCWFLFDREGCAPQKRGIVLAPYSPKQYYMPTITCLNQDWLL